MVNMDELSNLFTELRKIYILISWLDINRYNEKGPPKADESNEDNLFMVY